MPKFKFFQTLAEVRAASGRFLISFRHEFVVLPPSKREAFDMRFREKTNRIFNE